MVSVDTVYQRVLALANKEQRGYITPQEFNLFANQAQIAIFEQYFYDLDQAKRNIDNDDTTFSDIPELIKNKLTSFTSVQTITQGVFPINYRTGKIWINGQLAEKVDYNEASNFLRSTFHRKGLHKNPVYRESRSDGQDIDVITQDGDTTNFSSVQCEVITKPHPVMWGYVVVAGKAQYNASHSVDFQLHDSEETELVYKILELAGTTLNKPGLVQLADQEDLKIVQQEKM
tara:strand:+ start:1092 stop:1784 length:693 start_codon:yes stop_codon:yes gene_type:complete